MSRLVTFVSPQKGVDKAPLAEMIAGWPALSDLSPGSDFLNAVNGAPLPETVPITSIYTCSDEYIQPYQTSIIEGATNIGLCDGFVGHFQTFYDPEIYLIMHEALVKPTGFEVELDEDNEDIEDQDVVHGEPTDDPPTDDEPTDDPPTDDEPTDDPPTDDESTDEPPVDDEPTEEPLVDDEPTDGDASGLADVHIYPVATRPDDTDATLQRPTRSETQSLSPSGADGGPHQGCSTGGGSRRGWLPVLFVLFVLAARTRAGRELTSR